MGALLCNVVDCHQFILISTLKVLQKLNQAGITKKALGSFKVRRSIKSNESYREKNFYKYFMLKTIIPVQGKAVMPIL